MKAAVLQTYKKDGTAFTRPVWYREHDGAFEVVIAEGDVKLAHLRRDKRCVLVVFDVDPPFRGVAVSGDAELVEGDVTEPRAAIAGRYLGDARGRRFAEKRRSNPGVLVRLTGKPKRWDLSGLLEET